MTGMSRAAAADSQTFDKLESCGTSLGDVPVSVRDFASSVSRDLPAKLKLWNKLEKFENEDDQSYLPWTAVRSAATTVWWRSKLQMAGLRIVLVYAFVSALTSMACPPQMSQSVDKVATLSTSVRILVSAFLGVFLVASLSMWHKCLSGFNVLFDAIQHLQMQFISFECADEENAKTAMRYSLLSVHLLNTELCCEAQGGATWKQALAEMRAQMSIPMDEDTKCGLAHGGLLRDKELEILQGVDDAPGMLWVWVASLLGRMAQDGSIPPMESSTFGHITSLAQSASGGIRQARSCATGQTARTYSRLLAVAVHTSNFLSAVAFGVFIGSSNGVLLSIKEAPTNFLATELDTQAILVAFFLSVCAPVLYQVFLEVAVLVALPFASKHEDVPVNEMISRLQLNLQEAIVLTQQLQKPRIKMLPAQ